METDIEGRRGTPIAGRRLFVLLPFIACAGAVASCDLPHFQPPLMLDGNLTPLYACTASDSLTLSYDFCGASGTVTGGGISGPLTIVPPPPFVGRIGPPGGGSCAGDLQSGFMTVVPASAAGGSLSLTALEGTSASTPLPVPYNFLDPGQTAPSPTFPASGSPNCTGMLTFDPTVYAADVMASAITNTGAPILIIMDSGSSAISVPTGMTVSIPPVSVSGQTWIISNIPGCSAPSPCSCSAGNPRQFQITLGC
jgi:hypothetical protein